LYYVYKNETIPSDENVAFQTFILWWYRGISVIFGRISIDSQLSTRGLQGCVWVMVIRIGGGRCIRNDRRWFRLKWPVIVQRKSLCLDEEWNKSISISPGEAQF
jgi:hypothetical protein